MNNVELYILLHNDLNTSCNVLFQTRVTLTSVAQRRLMMMVMVMVMVMQF